ncbi:MAG TPA: M81 family metallopeptidase [Caulobacteraceae bacterium]|jgi:microcystin degradation protein MlrC|nr:M81 family metallopeptidase [Caulobacteraceae bacterium]
MRLFMAMLATETNTFAPLPTGWAAFKESGYFKGDASRHPDASTGVLLAEWRGLAEKDGIEVAEGTACAAQPGGRTLRGVYEALRDEILEQLAAALPLDVVLLNLHGAMVAEGYDDCEGDILARVRALTGSRTIVGVELDLHCNVTEAMFEAADAIIAYKEYPHTDELERGRELYALCRDAALGKVRPVTAVFDCAMISLWRTTEEPMRGFVAEMQAAEGRDGVLSVSFGHGFPWSDTAFAGARMWVIADGDRAKAEAEARRLGERIYRMRAQTRPTALEVGEALTEAGRFNRGPVVLADMADNPGGGAAADSTFILQACLDRGLDRVAIGAMWDPQAVALCMEAGVGARFALRVGGKTGPASGPPVDLMATVRAVSEAHSQQGLSGERVPLGRAAWIEAAGIDVVLVSRREQVFSPDAFTGLGLPLQERRIVAVKSTQHFHAAFASVAEAVLYVSSPGAIAPNFATIAYTKRDDDFWPKVDDPLGLDS